MHNKNVHMVAFLLLVVGGINWGLMGLVNFDLVAWLFVDLLNIEMLARITYILVGVAAVYELVTHKGSCSHCSAGGQREASAPQAGGDM